MACLQKSLKSGCADFLAFCWPDFCTRKVVRASLPGTATLEKIAGILAIFLQSRKPLSSLALPHSSLTWLIFCHSGLSITLEHSAIQRVKDGNQFTAISLRKVRGWSNGATTSAFRQKEKRSVWGTLQCVWTSWGTRLQNGTRLRNAWLFTYAP